MSLRLRLALTFGLVLGLTLISFGLILYFMMKGNIEEEADRRLSIRSQQVSATLWPGPTPPTPADLVAENLDLSPLAGLAARSLYVRVMDGERRVVATSPSLQNIDLQALNATSKPLPARPLLNDVDLGGGDRVRILTSPIRSRDGQAIGLLQVGQSRAAVDQTLEALRLRLLLLGAGAVLLAGAAGWLVATRGLRPLSIMSSRAKDLADRKDFAGRLAIQGSDEVGKLGATVDLLLGMVEETLRLHRSFLADTSHELRNPLFAVRTNLDLLDRLPSPASRDECLRETSEQVEKINQLVSELLLLARTEATQVIDQSALALSGLLEGVLADGRKRASGQLIELRVEGEATVLGDGPRLGQVFANLLDNALRYTAPTGTIVFTLRSVAGWAQVDVQDDGIGIGSDHLPRIFERFYRIERRSNDGTGLGLAIVKHICELHGGSITVSSQPGRGSCFTVRLPLLDLVPLTEPALAARG